MRRILGIDPGSRITGYAVIDVESNQNCYVTSGCLRTSGDALADRLGEIFAELSAVIQQHQPNEMAIEQVFMHRNADSALKLGQARGAAICAAVSQSLSIHEYSPREIKLAVVGKGGAAKAQVQHMVKVILNIQGEPQADAADALAVALCHAHTRHTLQKIPGAERTSGGRLR